jgi:hypothetical protein
MNKRRLLDQLHLKPGVQLHLTGNEPVYGYSSSPPRFCWLRSAG